MELTYDKIELSYRVPPSAIPDLIGKTITSISTSWDGDDFRVEIRLDEQTLPQITYSVLGDRIMAHSRRTGDVAIGPNKEIASTRLIERMES